MPSSGGSAADSSLFVTPAGSLPWYRVALTMAPGERGRLVGRLDDHTTWRASPHPPAGDPPYPTWFRSRRQDSLLSGVFKESGTDPLFGLPSHGQGQIGPVEVQRFGHGGESGRGHDRFSVGPIIAKSVLAGRFEDRVGLHPCPAAALHREPHAGEGFALLQ